MQSPGASYSTTALQVKPAQKSRCRLKSSLGFVYLSFSPFVWQHKGICEFPSQEFYETRLKTCPQLCRKPSVFQHKDNNCCPIIFGHVEGKEQSLIVSTEEENENSKANLEVEQAVRRVLGNRWRCEREEGVAQGDPGDRGGTMSSDGR